MEKDLIQNLRIDIKELIRRIIDDEFKKLNRTVEKATLLTVKEVLTSDEVAQYMGISKSYLYKLTMKQEIPHYKPMGKMCYFNRLELEQWLQSNRFATNEEIEQKAAAYCMNNKL